MAYAPNYYNYQVAVIFAIVIAAALLMAAVVGGIYFICVVNMRKQKGFSRAPSAMSRNGRHIGNGAVWQATPIEPQSIMVGYDVNAPAVSSGGAHDYQRSQPSPYSAAAAAVSYGGQQQPQAQQQAYLTQSMYQPQSQQMHPDVRVRDVHPEYAYQQGPITWTTNGQAIVAQPSSDTIQGYHMSSV